MEFNVDKNKLFVSDGTRRVELVVFQLTVKLVIDFSPQPVQADEGVNLFYVSSYGGVFPGHCLLFS